MIKKIEIYQQRTDSYRKLRVSRPWNWPKVGVCMVIAILAIVFFAPFMLFCCYFTMLWHHKHCLYINQLMQSYQNALLAYTKSPGNIALKQKCLETGYCYYNEILPGAYGRHFQESYEIPELYQEYNSLKEGLLRNDIENALSFYSNHPRQQAFPEPCKKVS